MKSDSDNMTEDKRRKIIAAAIKEFSKKGYEKASTNEIIKEAGVSKGLLFHYFDSKKNLYLRVIDDCIKYVEHYFYVWREQAPADMLERVMAWGQVKLKLFYKEPMIYQIIVSAFVDIPKELKKDIEKRYQDQIKQNMDIFFKNIDESKFRDGVDIPRTIDFLMLTSEAFFQRYISDCQDTKPKDLNRLQEDLEEYNQLMEMLKYGIYKRPEE